MNDTPVPTNDFTRFAALQHGVFDALTALGFLSATNIADSRCAAHMVSAGVPFTVRQSSRAPLYHTLIFEADPKIQYRRSNSRRSHSRKSFAKLTIHTCTPGWVEKVRAWIDKQAPLVQELVRMEAATVEVRRMREKRVRLMRERLESDLKQAGFPACVTLVTDGPGNVVGAEISVRVAGTNGDALSARLIQLLREYAMKA